MVISSNRLDLDLQLPRSRVHKPYPSLGHGVGYCGPLAVGSEDHGWNLRPRRDLVLLRLFLGIHGKDVEAVGGCGLHRGLPGRGGLHTVSRTVSLTRDGGKLLGVGQVMGLWIY